MSKVKPRHETKKYILVQFSIWIIHFELNIVQPLPSGIIDVISEINVPGVKIDQI